MAIRGWAWLVSCEASRGGLVPLLGFRTGYNGCGPHSVVSHPPAWVPKLYGLGDGPFLLGPGAGRDWPQMAVASFQFDDAIMWEVLKQLADREDVGITEAFIRLIIIGGSRRRSREC